MITWEVVFAAGMLLGFFAGLLCILCADWYQRRQAIKASDEHRKSL